jgi:dihydroxy-acid dehydratase
VQFVLRVSADVSSVDKPWAEASGTTILYGNLCPDGAVIKPSAATPELLQHRGQAVVFESIEDYYDRIDDPDLDVTADSVMVLKGIGPRGFPGMPEEGKMGLPKKLLEQGVRDMVRISDGRMSGTAYGAVVLHVAPESAVGGPLALVQEGDWIELDVANRRLHLDVAEEELARRRAAWTAPSPHQDRGYVRLYTEHVMQANTGCDMDFLVGKSGAEPARQQMGRKLKV